MEAIQISNPAWDEIAHRVRPHDYHFDCNVIKVDYTTIDRDEIFLRDRFCKQYAWAIPDPDSIAFVAEHATGGIIEIGAGMGYWAWQISQHNISVLAYDIDPPDDGYNRFHNPDNKQGIATYYPVERGSYEMLDHHSDRTFFLCWPPYASDMAYQCLTRYQGNRVIYVGEGEGGCTGDGQFFSKLDEEWEPIAEHNVVQWYGMNDYITVFDRKRLS